MKNIIEIASCILDIIIVFIYFNGVLERKENNGKKLLVFWCGAVVLNIIRSNFFLPFLANICVTIVLWSLIALLCFDGTYLRKLFFVIINIIAIMISEILTALFLSLFFKLEYDDGFTMRYLGMALSTLLLFIFNTYAVYIAKKRYRNLPIKYNILIILCPLFSLYLLLLLDSYIAQARNPLYLMSFITVIGLVYINIMVFDFFDYYEKGLRAQTLDVILQANEENYKIIEENERELRIIRHDIMKYMTEISEMINNGNGEAAGKYAEGISDIVMKDTSVSRSGNLILDTILNIESKKATALGIKYDVKLNITEAINVSSVDLSSILYNAIDNAIEACEKVKEKYILISITADDKTLKISIENTSQPVTIENNKIKTTKADHLRHGYGIASIKKALKNNDGFITLNYENGIFACRMMMKNNIQ